MKSKFCFGCHKNKSVDEYDRRPSGRLKEYCRDCENKFNLPKRPPKVIKEGNGTGVLSKMGKPVDLKKRYVKLSDLPPELRELPTVYRRRPRTKRDRTKNKRLTSEEYLDRCVKPFIKECGDGFSSNDFKKYNQFTKSWLYRVLLQLEDDGFLLVKRGYRNVYYLSDKSYKCLGLNREDTGVYLDEIDF